MWTFMWIQLEFINHNKSYIWSITGITEPTRLFGHVVRGGPPGEFIDSYEYPQRYAEQAALQKTTVRCLGHVACWSWLVQLNIGDLKGFQTQQSI